MARLRTVYSVLLSVFLFIPMLSRADTCEQGTTAAYINLRTGDFYSCPLVFAPGLLFVFVDINSVPATEVHFSIPDPPFGTLLSAQWSFPATGTLQTGIDMSLGPCTGPNVTLGYLVVLVPSGLPADCATWKANDGAAVLDCEGNVRPALSASFLVSAGGGFCQCCLECGFNCVPAYHLAPADGALAVPLTGPLTWQGTGWPGIEHTCSVQIGTDPDCSTWTTYPADCLARSFEPDFLQPETTYYWRVLWTNPWCGLSASPVRSFTTQGPVSVTTSTWGQVKAMYRD